MVNWGWTKEEKNERPPSQNLEGEAEERDQDFEKNTDKNARGLRKQLPMEWLSA